MTFHLSDEQLTRLAQGQIRGQEATDVFSHLLACEACGRQFEMLSGTRDNPSDAYELHDGLLQRVDQLRQQAIKASADARAVVEDLLSQPPSRRQTVLRNSEHLPSAEVVRQLLLQARELVFDDPAESLSLASLALETVHSIADRQARRGEDTVDVDLLAACWTDLANYRRILSDLAGAREALRQASAHVEAGTTDLSTEMHYFEVLSGIHWASRDFAAARRANARFMRMARDTGENHQLGRGVMFRATIEASEHGDAKLPEVIEMGRRALELLDPTREPRVYAAALNNLVTTLASDGRTSEAKTLLERVKPLPATQQRAIKFRVLWTESRLVQREGDLAAADTMLEQVVEGLSDVGQLIPAAQALLELATLRFEARRFTEVRELAARTLPVFQSQGIHREALAAYTLFVRAAEAETLTRALLTELQTYFGQFRPRDARPFRSQTGDATIPS
jgi:hypothetical protein